MTPLKLGTEIGNISARAINFLHDKFVGVQQVSSELKKQLSLERIEIFGKYIPLIKQFKTYSEGDIKIVKSTTALTIVEKTANIIEISETLQKTVGVIAEDEAEDETFLMDFLSLYMIQGFLDEDTFNSDEALDLPKYVGLN